MSRFVVAPGGSLRGTVQVPGDKSISHRAVMLSAIARGTSQLRGLLTGTDVLATVAALQSMGVAMAFDDQRTMTVHGVGRRGLAAPDRAIDLGNSGTAMRLLAGLLSGQGFAVDLTGDASLSRRPMRRVTAPLREMGADIDASPAGTPPLAIRPAERLEAIRYRLPVASAQVKSALLLAGLYADGRTCIAEPAPSRDHTERMLRGLGVPVDREGDWICLQPGELQATDIDVPGDISSAAFFLVGALLAADSAVTLTRVGVNPTRTGVLDILRAMGADIRLENPHQVAGEPVADLRVASAGLRGIDIPAEWVPLAIDEFPAICVAAALAEGSTRIRGAGELRHKESDRIHAMAVGLRALGVAVEETEDGMHITGRERLGGGELDSFTDHRIAMALCMAAPRATAPVTVRDVANVATSFPDFEQQSRQLGLRLKHED